MSKQTLPNIELYQNLSHKERILQEFPYSPADEELYDERIKAKQLTEKYNELEVIDKKGKQDILDVLLNPSCRGKKLGVHIYAATHPLDAKYRQDNDDYCQIGFAGAVVAKNVPANVLVGGNPAKIIRNLD